MTIEEFNKLKFGMWMQISHTCTMTASVKIYDVMSVNFAEHTFGVKNGEAELCNHCGEEIQILSWLNCENCELIKAEFNLQMQLNSDL